MVDDNDNTSTSRNTASTQIKSEKESKKPHSRQSAKRNLNKKKKSRSSPQTSTFQGSTDKLKQHVFQCYGEANSNTQFSKTCEELEHYALTKFKFGTDIQYLIHHMKECSILPPSDPGSTALRLLCQ